MNKLDEGHIDLMMRKAGCLINCNDGDSPLVEEVACSVTALGVQLLAAREELKVADEQIRAARSAATRELHDLLEAILKRETEWRDQWKVMAGEWQKECAKLEKLAETYRKHLLRIAARATHWSSADVRAACADALGVGVRELERMIEG